MVRRTRSAFSSTSRPVSTKVMVLRHPPRRLTDTFSSSGRGRPRAPRPGAPGPARPRRGGSSRSPPPRRGWRRAARDLVQELGGDGPDRHEAPGAGVLGDHGRAVRVHLGDREAGVLEPGDLAEEGVVAAGGLGPALDDVAHRHRARQAVPVGAVPTRSATPPGRPRARRRSPGPSPPRRPRRPGPRRCRSRRGRRWRSPGRSPPPTTGARCRGGPAGRRRPAGTGAGPRCRHPRRGPRPRRGRAWRPDAAGGRPTRPG